MQRIGVFVCHCGTNIASTVDVKTVAETLGKEPAVVFARKQSKNIIWMVLLYVLVLRECTKQRSGRQLQLRA